MFTLIHVSPTVYAGLGIVMLRVDTSGDPAPGDLVVIARRIVGSTSPEEVIPAAGYLSESSTVHLINGSSILFDTTVPLDTAVEYLAYLPGEDPEVVTGGVTVPSGMIWRLGDPVRPYLDLPLTLSRANPVECPTTAGAKIILSLSDDSLDMQSEIMKLPGSRTPLTYTEPIASPTFEIRFATRSVADRQAAENLLAPGGVLLLRAPSVYQFVQRYLVVTSAKIERISADHRKSWRIFTVQAKECSQPPGAAYGWLGARWLDLCYGGYADWDAILAAGLSWGSLGTGIAGGGYPSEMRTYAEVDATYAIHAALIATGKTYSDLVTGA